MTFRSDLGAILGPSWGPKKKIMMTRMALRSHIGDHEGVRHLDFRAGGGGKEEG